MDKKRILIIDDEPGFTRMVKLNLEKTGFFEVREENKATYAMPAVSEQQPLAVWHVVMDHINIKRPAGIIQLSIGQQCRLIGIKRLFGAGLNRG